MSDNLQKKLYIFSVISKIRNKKLRTSVLNEFIKDKDFYGALNEIAVNTLKGNIKFNPKQKRQLSRCRKTLMMLANKNKRNKKKIASKLSGGFWSFLIPIVFELFRKV